MFPFVGGLGGAHVFYYPPAKSKILEPIGKKVTRKYHFAQKRLLVANISFLEFSIRSAPLTATQLGN